jgi:hypothetical protein
MKSVREHMGIHAAYREVGSYRTTAEICGTTRRSVKCSVLAAKAAERGVAPGPPHNYDPVKDLVERTKGKISAKRLLPVVQPACYDGSARNLRRLVADVKRDWRHHHRGRRHGVFVPGDMVVFDWGEIGPLYVFCAVAARVRFVYFADNLGDDATTAALARCFEYLGAMPKTGLTNRMGFLKGGPDRTGPDRSCRRRPTSASPPEADA